MARPGADLRDVMTANSGRSGPEAAGRVEDASIPALVVSLDFELHWGVRDIHAAASGYTSSLLGAREAIPRLLDLFAEFDVAATWATVGFLFAESRDELEFFHPRLRPRYEDANLDAYRERVGMGEADDPLHFAPGLIRRIGSTPRQEIGTHTYSHYYCLERGGTAETFREDMESAVAIGRARGIEVRSIVLPRNQWNPEYAPILAEVGIECYRGTQPGWMYDAARTASEGRLKRGSRLLDAHLPLTSWGGTDWGDVSRASGLHDVRATCFLRPVSEGSRALNELRLRRITDGISRAARRRRIFHLWWHPHNFGGRTAENLAFLRSILQHFRVMSSEHGMRSLSMIEAARHAARLHAAPARGHG